MKSPDNRRLLGTPTEKFTTTTCFTLEQTTLTRSVKIKNSQLMLNKVLTKSNNNKNKNFKIVATGAAPTSPDAIPLSIITSKNKYIALHMNNCQFGVFKKP